MKKSKILFSLLLAGAMVIAAGCGASKAQSSNSNKIVVGASSTPHAEILNHIKPALKAKGIDLEVKEMNDYVTPNTALNDKQIDANFFQHVPYMEDFEKKHNMKLVAIAKVHVEPMGAYSSKIKSKSEIKDGSLVAVPNDATNEGRALILLQNEGYIKLRSKTDLAQTPRDVVKNPKNLRFQEVEAPQLPRILQDVDFAIINTNYALEGKLDPKNALFSEGKDSPYANVLTVRPDNKDSKAVKELVKALHSNDVKKFILDKYKGAILPAF